MSKKELREGGILHAPSNWIRRFLVESIYRRLGKSVTGGGFHAVAHTRTLSYLVPGDSKMDWSR